MDGGLGSVAFVIVDGQVVHDVIDDEVVVVHLGTGNYYSLRGPALAVWLRLAQPATVAETADVIAASWALGSNSALLAAPALLSYLVGEGLILAERPVDSDPLALESLDPDIAAALMVEKFTDVQELLTIDPVHDVDDRGWPSTPTVGIESVERAL